MVVPLIRLIPGMVIKELNGFVLFFSFKKFVISLFLPFEKFHEIKKFFRYKLRRLVLKLFTLFPVLVKPGFTCLDSFVSKDRLQPVFCTDNFLNEIPISIDGNSYFHPFGTVVINLFQMICPQLLCQMEGISKIGFGTFFPSPDKPDCKRSVCGLCHEG